MKNFMIVLSTPADMCLTTLEQASGVADMLDGTLWGIVDGDFTGWVVIEADSEEEARGMLPNEMQSEARIFEVRQYDQDDLSALRRKFAA